MPQLYAGTSGFAYPAWKPAFYPAKLAAAKFLGYYASRLNSVEINYTFHRLPAAKTLENWVAQTTDGFLFTPKAHERITHQMKLREAGEFTEIFLKSIDPLRATRLSIWTTGVCVLWAAVLEMFWHFPQPWGLMMVASISIAAQLAAPWLSQAERAKLRQAANAVPITRH